MFFRFSVFFSRYGRAPPAPTAPVSVWEEAVESAKRDLEYSQDRLLNLELLAKNCGAAWAVHRSQVEALLAKVQHDVSRVTEQMEQVNKKRKMDQMAEGNLLRPLTREFNDLNLNSGQTIMAIRDLEGSIRLYVATARQRGVRLPKGVLDSVAVNVPGGADAVGVAEE